GAATATSSARTSSTTRAIRGARGRSTSTTSITFRRRAHGSRATSPKPTPSIAGDLRCPRISAAIVSWRAELSTAATIRRVLVTGLSGLIGGALHGELAGKYALRALNRRPVAGVECHLADLADLDAIRPAFADIDAVVHLGAAAGANNAPDDIICSNVLGTYNVFEGPRWAGVPRVIFASSGATVAGWEKDPPLSHLVAGRYDKATSWPRLTHESPTRPSGLTGADRSGAQGRGGV